MNCKLSKCRVCANLFLDVSIVAISGIQEPRAKYLLNELMSAFLCNEHIIFLSLLKGWESNKF